MRINIRKVLSGLAVAALTTAYAFASPAPTIGSKAYASERASRLLLEIRQQASDLSPHAETLGSFAWNPQISWESHAFYLERVKGNINAVGERLAELQQIRDDVLPWQREAIRRVTSHAAQVAASTQAAIEYLGDNQDRLFVPDYRAHLTTIADRSQEMHETVAQFLKYENAQKEFRHLQNVLEFER